MNWMNVLAAISGIALSMGAIWIVLKSWVPGDRHEGMREKASRGEVFLCETVNTFTKCGCLNGFPVAMVVTCGAGRGGAVCLMCMREEFTAWSLWRLAEADKLRLYAETLGVVDGVGATERVLTQSQSRGSARPCAASLET